MFIASLPHRNNACYFKAQPNIDGALTHSLMFVLIAAEHIIIVTIFKYTSHLYDVSTRKKILTIFATWYHIIIALSLMCSQVKIINILTQYTDQMQCWQC